jgi:hypothetical protein
MLFTLSSVWEVLGQSRETRESGPIDRSIELLFPDSSFVLSAIESDALNRSEIIKLLRLVEGPPV